MTSKFVTIKHIESDNVLWDRDEILIEKGEYLVVSLMEIIKEIEDIIADPHSFELEEGHYERDEFSWAIYSSFDCKESDMQSGNWVEDKKEIPVEEKTFIINCKGSMVHPNFFVQMIENGPIGLTREAGVKAEKLWMLSGGLANVPAGVLMDLVTRKIKYEVDNELETFIINPQEDDD